jgi:hypothetical protein
VRREEGREWRRRGEVNRVRNRSWRLEAESYNSVAFLVFPVSAVRTAEMTQLNPF